MAEPMKKDGWWDLWFIKADERRRADGEDDRERGGEGGGRRVNSLFLCLLLLIKERDYTLPGLFIHSVREKKEETREGLWVNERVSERESWNNGEPENEKVRLWGCYCFVLLLLLMCLLGQHETSPVMLVNKLRVSWMIGWGEI